MSTQLRVGVWCSCVVAIVGCGGDTAIVNAEEAMRSKLRDPGSAQFRNVERCGAGEIVHGEVNGKNSYGAYTGFTKFYSDGVSASSDFGDYDHRQLFEACMLDMMEDTARIRGQSFDRKAEADRLMQERQADKMDDPE